MAILNCTVGNCHYNKNNLCSLDSIHVEGSEATVAAATACGSFKERTNDSYSNMAGCCPSKTASIDCGAVHCTYNKECKCHAGQIHVSGPNAHQSADTQCSTFEDK